MKFILFLVAVLLMPNWTYGQNDSRSFPIILQTYYLHQDKDVVDKAVDFLNNTPMSYTRLEPLLTGFLTALYKKDENIKQRFRSNLSKVNKSDFKQLLEILDSLDIDSFYTKADRTPAFNDMNWSSYFATGETKYLDNIVLNVGYSSERSNLNLFLAGATAKWSLSSNARQDKMVHQYLTSLAVKRKEIEEILSKEPQLFREEMVEILKQQRAKGIWN